MFTANSSLRAFRLWCAYVDVTMFKKIKMETVLQLKLNNYILETRISLLPSDNRKNLTWVFIRMYTIVTSSDMTSFVYIGDEKHHLSKWLGKEKKWPPAKRNWAIFFIEWLKKAKTNCKRCWINQATVMQ